MKRPIIAIFFSLQLSLGFSQNQIYEFRTYELDFFKSADLLHAYFEKALIPALNRQGIGQVGVFEETGQALPKKIYLLITYDSFDAYIGSLDKLEGDSQYQKDAKEYFEAPDTKIPYDRIETSLIRSATGFPSMTKREGAKLFELRIYLSKNEDALRR